MKTKILHQGSKQTISVTKESIYVMRCTLKIAEMVFKENKVLFSNLKEHIELNHQMTSKLVFTLLSANPTKWSNRPKQFVCNLQTNFQSVFDHFVGLLLKGLRYSEKQLMKTP